MEVKRNMNNSGQDYNKEEQAIKALQKNYFLCAALTLAVGVGMLAFTSYKVIGIICIVLCVVFGVMGIVLVVKPDMIDVSEDGVMSYKKKDKPDKK